MPSSESVLNEIPLSKKDKEKREEVVAQIQNILKGKDKRKLLLIGPCSADVEESVIDYAQRLARVSEKVSDKLLLIPRVYTGKPRTNGTGYKGLLHRPDPAAEHDNLLAGVIATRKMHLHVIEQSGLFPVDEMLYPELFYYYSDLLAYAAIGARSVENQQHRMVASGMDTPVGLKNTISGDMNTLINSILAAQSHQAMVYNDWFVRTDGNPYAHAILRGYNDISGQARPNYHYEDLQKLYDLYQKSGLKNPGVVVDCNHGNSGKQYMEQIRIAHNVFDFCKRNHALAGFVKGLMIESYIEDGNQMIGGGVYGKSITDPCLGWEKTERLILELAEYNFD